MLYLLTENLRIANRHLHGLDYVSEQSESSVISKKSSIKICERDQIRFDGMIVSDESDDDSVDSNPIANQENFMIKNMVNVSTYIPTNNSIANFLKLNIKYLFFFQAI